MKLKVVIKTVPAWFQLFFKGAASSFVSNDDQIFVTPATWTLTVKSMT